MCIHKYIDVYSVCIIVSPLLFIPFDKKYFNCNYSLFQGF